MAALEENIFDDVLVSRSVFVSPVAPATDRYGNQPDNPDDLDKNSWEIEDTEPYNHGEDIHWGWTDPRESIAGSDHLGEKGYVDYEDGVSQQPMPQEDHNATWPHRPPKQEEDASFTREKRDDKREEGGEQGERNMLEDTDARFDKVDNDSTPCFRNDDSQDLESSRMRQAEGIERTSKVDINDVEQRDSPLPAAPQLTGFLESHSLEDQPIRGLANGREMSLDELIAQGERQMQEAQAKTTAAKGPRGRGGGGAARGGIKNATSTVHQRSNDAVAIPPIMERRSPSPGEDRPNKASDIHPSGHRMGQRPESPGASPGNTAKQGYQFSPLSTSNRGGVDMGGEVERGRADEGGSGMHGSVSLRNASFATSWSCGDSEQQLRHLSMGVPPALGATDPAYEREAESRCERERREFYELEMELLREEQEGEAMRGRGDQQTEPRGQDPEGDDNFWDNEDQPGSYEARGRHGRDGSAENLVVDSEIPSQERRNPGSGHGSDRTYVNEPDSYRQLANDGAKATVASSHLPPKSLQGNINGQDYDDEDETRRWEEAGGGEEKPEVRGREQSTRYNPFIPAVESTDYPSSDYPSAGAPDVPRRRATFHSSSNANVGSENDYFDDGRALKGARMAVEPVNGIPKPNSRGDWSRPADSLSILAPQRNEDRRGVPSQSKLVQRVFGGRGGRGRGVGGRTKMNGRGQRGARGPGTTRDGGEQREDRAESWPVQAELEGKLRELEDEIARYKEENKRVVLARRKQETTVAEIMKRRQEVREWAEAERAAVEAWCSEQRQAAAREKRAVMKQIQGLRARAQAGGASGAGTATERRQRQEIEALKATVEKAKLDAEAARKKARASERRLQQQIKSGVDRIDELEGQVSFLERKRVEVWAESRRLTGELTTSSRPQKSKMVGLSASVGVGVGRGERGAFSPRVVDVDGPMERCRDGRTVSVAVERPASSQGFSGWVGEDQGDDKSVLQRDDDGGTGKEEHWEDEETSTADRRDVGRRRNMDITSNGGFVREGGVMTAEGEKRGRVLENDWPTITSGSTRGNVSDVGSVDERRVEDNRMMLERSRMSSSGQRWRGEGQSRGLGDHDGERLASRMDPRFRPPAAVGHYEYSEGFSSSGQRDRRRNPLLDPQQQTVGVNDRDRGFSVDARVQKSPGLLMEEMVGPPEERHGAWEFNRGGRPRTSGGVKYDPMRYETSGAVVAQKQALPREQTIDRRRGDKQSPPATVSQTSLMFPRSVDSGSVGSGDHGRGDKEETNAPVPEGRFKQDTGSKVEHVLRDGRRIVLFANGTQKETLPDGGCVVRFMNGDLKRVEGKTGVVVYTYAAAQTVHTMYPSGLEVFQFPNGQVERHHKSGEKEISFPDGTRKTILTCGREMSEFSDGVIVVEYPEGHRDVTSPNGTSHREYPDGTMTRLPSRSLENGKSASFASRAAESRGSSAGSASFSVGEGVSNQGGDTFVRNLRRSRSGWG